MIPEKFTVINQLDIMTEMIERFGDGWYYCSVQISNEDWHHLTWCFKEIPEHIFYYFYSPTPLQRPDLQIFLKIENGLISNHEGPAILINDSKETHGVLFFKKGILHREGDAPAILIFESKENISNIKLESLLNNRSQLIDCQYYQEGSLHRLLGPAHNSWNYCDHYIQGVFISKEDFEKDLRVKRAILKKTLQSKLSSIEE